MLPAPEIEEPLQELALACLVPGVWSGPDLGHGRRLVAVDRSVLREAHDMEGLLDGRRQAAETELALDLQHLLDDLDEDGDADRVDDLGAGEVEKEDLVALFEEL